MADHTKLLASIAKSTDPDGLREIIKKAKAADEKVVEAAAFERLIRVVPAEAPDTVECDFWRTVNAFEQLRSDQNGRTTRLARTRQKVARVGVMQVLEDWAVGKATDGYDILMGLQHPELTGEAIVLRHPSHFSPAAVLAASNRLGADGVDIEAVKAYR